MSTKRNCGGTMAKLTICAGVNTILYENDSWVLEEYHHRSTHQPRMSVGAYIWLPRVNTTGPAGSNETHTVLRLSATPEAPLPSIRDIDVKNPPTTTVEQSTGFQRERTHTNYRPRAEGGSQRRRERTNVVP